MIFAAMAVISPYTNADGTDLARMEKTRSDLATSFSLEFGASDVRIEQQGGFNVQVWIPRRAFESVDYLDRKAFMEASGNQWCNNADGASSPTLTVKDAGDAKSLAIFHCTFRYATMNPNNGW
jgi:hypothetical protein